VPSPGIFSVPPTLTAVVPVCVRIEFWILVAVVNIGILFAVPPVVVTFKVPVGGGLVELGLLAVVEGAPAAMLEGAARRNAEAGKPPRVSASPDFRA
jgi:hypothetical protein